MEGNKNSLGAMAGLLASLHFFVATPISAQPPLSDRGSSNRNLDSAQQSHPWLASAPGEYVRLINRGKVQIKADDAMLAAYGKAALTRFQIHLDYKCIYGQPKSVSIDGVPVSLLDVRYTKRDVNVEHTIVIPRDYSPDEPWKERLLKHEMDHVAITTDPRLQSMVQGVFSRGFTIQVQPSADRTKPNTEYQSRIDQFTKDRILEIESLLQFQYNELDRFSSDGLSDLEDRESFFRSLYEFDACKKYLPVILSSVTKETWDRWVRIEAKKLAVHYSLSR